MDYKGIVAVIIVSTLGASMLTTIAALAWRDRQISDKAAEVLTATVSGMLVVLGYHMGSKNGQK